jgi:mannonate dehydratase
MNQVSFASQDSLLDIREIAGDLAHPQAIGCLRDARDLHFGPGNVSPVGHTINMHLDLAIYNFGIQEENRFSANVREVFPGAPEIKGGYMYANDKPGLGIDIDENIAAKFPYQGVGGSRGNDRRLDGSIVRP